MKEVSLFSELKAKVPEIKRLAIKLFFSRTAILVYQMGKVGSTTVYYSLKNHFFLTPVFHVHCLGDRDLQEHEQSYLSMGENPQKIRYLRHGNFLRKKLDESDNIQWKIITLVRDPIAREISMFFQQIERKYPNSINENQIIDALQQKIFSFTESEDYMSNWFDREIKSNFNIDIYDYDFDKQKGYLIIKSGNTEALVVRLEDLNDCFDSATKELFKTTEFFEITSKNIASKKKYKDKYTEVIEQIKIPKDICKKIYSSQYIRHFYSDIMISKLIDKWAKD